MSILESYQQALAAKGYQADPAQEKAVHSLQRLADELLYYDQAKQSLVKRWFSKPTPPKGIYLWGGVGRGKSFLMDLFYQSISIEKKIRLHFQDRKSTRLNSSHVAISYAVFCLKKKKKRKHRDNLRHHEVTHQQ